VRYPIFISILLLITTLACNQNKPIEVSSGQIEVIQLQSEYVDDRRVDVWLPEGYSEREKHAVVYMHDGQMLFDSTTTWNGQEWKVDEVLQKLINEKKIRPTIVVGVYNNGDKRFIEYFPEKAIPNLPDSIENQWARGKGREAMADEYLSFLVNELKPEIERRYAVHTGPANTFIGGSSMGGLISLYALCEYPEVFGGAFCMSTHWIGMMEDNRMVPRAINAYVQNNLPDPASHKIYFDHGTATLDANYPPHQDMIDSTFKAGEYTDEQYMSLEFEGHPHNEQAWSSRLHRPFKFLLGE